MLQLLRRVVSVFLRSVRLIRMNYVTEELWKDVDVINEDRIAERRLFATAISAGDAARIAAMSRLQVIHRQS